MVLVLKVGVHRRVTKTSGTVGFDSQPVHVKKVLLVILLLTVFMVYLFVTGKA